MTVQSRECMMKSVVRIREKRPCDMAAQRFRNFRDHGAGEFAFCPDMVANIALTTLDLDAFDHRTEFVGVGDVEADFGKLYSRTFQAVNFVSGVGASDARGLKTSPIAIKPKRWNLNALDRGGHEGRHVSP